VKFKRLFAYFALVVLGTWVALLNGQPLFHPDTSAYVRGPDFAVVYFFGKRLATSWTQTRTLEGEQVPSSVTGAAPQAEKLNSPYDKSVMAGRSIYYGALLYLGHLTSKLWLPVFLQAAVFVYLTYTLAVTCLRFSLLAFIYFDIAILVLTPVSFYLGYLMPDVFASFLILGMIILFVFWDALKLHDRIIVSVIILYSIVVHSSQLLLLFGLVAVAFLITFLGKRPASASRHSLVVLLILFVCGILADLAFAYAIRAAIGASPIRPPFLTARLIADGPGYQFLREHCATRPYVVCRFISRLPVAAPAFLWSIDPAKGVFSVSDPSTRRALSSEQINFAVDVVQSNPMGVTTAAAKNMFYEFHNIGIDEFFLTPWRLEWAKGSLPKSYFDELSRTHIASSDWFNSALRSPVDGVYFGTYLLSFMGLALSLLVWPVIRGHTNSNGFQERQWFYIVSMTTFAIVLNAAICGILSEPIVMRYQTRIAWIPVFIFSLLVVSIWASLSAKSKRLESRRQINPAPFV